MAIRRATPRSASLSDAPMAPTCQVTLWRPAGVSHSDAWSRTAWAVGRSLLAINPNSRPICGPKRSRQLGCILVWQTGGKNENSGYY
jgi:hypothetical protein